MPMIRFLFLAAYRLYFAYHYAGFYADYKHANYRRSPCSMNKLPNQFHFSDITYNYILHCATAEAHLNT